MISLCFLDGLEVSGSHRPCGGEEGSIETIPFRGAECGAVGFSEHGEEL